MERINTTLMAKLNDMVDEATKSEEHKLASALSKLQIEIIEERTKAWESGFDAGFSLGVRNKGFCGFVSNQVKE